MATMSIEEIIVRAVSHHVNPIIGRIRLADSNGVDYEGRTLAESYALAAAEIAQELGLDLAEQVAPTIK